MSIWSCPVCGDSLELDQRSFRCEANHSFDMAKEGYINLLLANQKKSQQPGDDKQQLQGRRRFLQQGFYQPLLLALYQQLQLKGGLKLADVGCGEGYYSQGLVQLAEANQQMIACHGIDIAKEGVRMAAKAAKQGNIQYAVASSFNMPWQDKSLDRVFRVFAPGRDEEVVRVLKDDGLFVVVSPGPNHLLQLRQCIYQQVEPHQEPPVPQGFTLIERQALDFSMTFETQEQFQDLLLMTPFNWRGHNKLEAKLEHCQADFVLQVYQKC